MTPPVMARSPRSSTMEVGVGRSCHIASTALSSGLPAAFASMTTSSAVDATKVLDASRRQREQQDALLQRAELELLKAARRAQAALEPRPGYRRVGGAPGGGLSPPSRPGVVGRPVVYKRSGVSASELTAAALSPGARSAREGLSAPASPKSVPRMVRGALNLRAPGLDAWDPDAEDGSEATRRGSLESTASCDSPRRSPQTWKRHERTVEQYVLSRNVGS
ncbi:unnamed protein product, partial [Polarella glacialis]